MAQGLELLSLPIADITQDKFQIFLPSVQLLVLLLLVLTTLQAQRVKRDYYIRRAIKDATKS